MLKLDAKKQFGILSVPKRLIYMMYYILLLEVSQKYRSILGALTSEITQASFYFSTNSLPKLCSRREKHLTFLF